MNCVCYYNLRQAMEPIWNRNIIYNESLLFIPDYKEKNKTLPCRLLFQPKEILSVFSGDYSVRYIEGVDYTIKDDCIYCIKGGRMPYFTFDEYYLKQPASIPIESVCCPGRYVRYEPDGIEVIKRQVVITYTHNMCWEGELPHSQLGRLPVTKDKLKNKKSFELAFFGDSFMEGCDSSGRSGLAPYLPTMDRLVTLSLADHYQHTHIHVINKSLGGTTSKWGADTIRTRIAIDSPDMVVIRFGMNDSGAKINVPTYIKNINNMVEICREYNKDVEFLLLPSDLPNPDCKGWIHYQPDYFYALKEYADKKAGCGFVPITRIFSYIEKRKDFPSMTTNLVNHPNDFMIRIYARAIMESLM